MAAPNRKGGSGRKKTVIRRIERTNARHICYSKRRMGFFTKASDLVVLTGAQVAALAFSPGGNAFSFGHPSVDSVVERFLAGQGAGAGAREAGAAGKNKKLQKLRQEFDELRTGLVEMKKRAEHKEEVMAKERAAGDQIATWVDPNARDMGDDDMAAFFAALMQVKDVVSERANQVLREAMHADVSRMAIAPPPPPQIFGGSTFEFSSSSGSANDGMENQLLVPPPQGQGFVAGMDMEEQMVMAAGMDMEQMEKTIPQPPCFDAEIDEWLTVMLPPAGMETVQQGLDQPNAGFPY